jgi:ABC-type glycerol-3-phosphate transport system permease component
VFQWNSYFAGLIYLKSNEWYPLQLVLREILVQAQQSANSLQDINSIGDRDKIAALVRFGIIIVSSVPMLILYPFLQKYFVQGVMIGSIKG